MSCLRPLLHRDDAQEYRMHGLGRFGISEDIQVAVALFHFTDVSYEHWELSQVLRGTQHLQQGPGTREVAAQRVEKRQWGPSAHHSC